MNVASINNQQSLRRPPMAVAPSSSSSPSAHVQTNPISCFAVNPSAVFIGLVLEQSGARDKICRAIQYGSKCLSNGEPGAAQNVDKSTSLARKVFRLFKFINDLHGLISPTAPGTPLPLILLGKSKNALLSTFLFLDQIVWLGRTGIYKNKERPRTHPTPSTHTHGGKAKQSG
ncbi:peroxisomal membrane protein 11-5-like [Nicotiana sylvestris]|uniref:peroxisomal membrane protein 11-5-like n=1 Tax=Nicotiana sylvestris TaxID=4096 RepID=UPI00388C498A